MFRRRTAALAAVAITAVATAGVASAPAGAGTADSPVPVLRGIFDVNGTTTIAKSDITYAVGPTKLSTVLYSDNSIRGNLPIPPVSVSSDSGPVPTTIDMSFAQVGPSVGTVSPASDGNLAIDAVAKYVVTLTDVTFGGNDAQVGTNCQTRNPVVFHVKTPRHHGISFVTGGQLLSTFAIGKFINCGPAQKVINGAIGGPNNHLVLQLTNGKIKPVRSQPASS